MDEAGQSVADASIQASWRLTGKTGSSDGNVSTKTDAKGAFVLEGLGPGATVSITGQFRGRQSKGPVEVRAGEAGPVTVAIVPTRCSPWPGACSGQTGHRSPRFRSRCRFGPRKTTSRDSPAQVRFEDGRADQDRPGRFVHDAERDRAKTERGPDRGRRRRVFASPRRRGSRHRRQNFSRSPTSGSKRSRGVRTITGRVVDRDGNPMAGVSVSQAGDGPRWTAAKTGPDGRCRLPGVGDGAALVFVEAPGCRFAGAITRNRNDSVEIRVARMNEPPFAAVRMLASPLSRAQERALAKELLEPLLPARAIGLSSATSARRRSRPWHGIDPLRVIEMIENRAVAGLSGSLIQVALVSTRMTRLSRSPASMTTVTPGRGPPRGSRSRPFALRPIVLAARTFSSVH